MSLRVTWDGALPAGEPMDVVMEDCASWAPANTVLKAGRELSSWFFKRPSQRRPSLFSLCSSPRETEFYDTDSLMDMDTPRRPLGINDLPPEVLGEIFVAYLDAPDLDDFPTSHEVARYRVSSHLYSPSSPILLSQVCSTWRTFTQSIPTLWRRISVGCPRPQDISLFAQWLERSGESPIDLTLVDCFGTGEISTIAIREIFRIALTQSHRWKAITFDLATDMGDLVVSQALPPAMALHSFDIKMADWSETSLRSLLHLLYSSSSLHKVTYSMPSSNAALSAILQTPDALFPTISHLEVGYIAAEELFPLLDRYASLTHLSFRTITNHGYPYLSSQPLILSTLQSLRLDHSFDIVPLLNTLCLPSLKHLELPNGFSSTSSPNCDSDEGWEALFNLIERSSLPEAPFGLQSLVLKVRGMEEERVTQGLSSPLLAPLRSLSIKSKVGDQLVKALTLPRGEEQGLLGLLPRLEELILDSCWCSDGLLTELVFSRQNYLKRVQATMLGSQSFPRDMTLTMPGVCIKF